MTESFKVLADFLKQFDPQVSGRGAEPPPADIHEKLKLFAKGVLPQDERTRLCEILVARPEWVEILVREAKALRSNNGSGNDPGA